MCAPGCLTAAFLDGVVRTQARSLHGAIALSNGLVLMIVAYAVHVAGTPTRYGWPTVLFTAALVVGSGIALWPAVRALTATVRPSAQQEVTAPSATIRTW